MFTKNKILILLIIGVFFLVNICVNAETLENSTLKCAVSVYYDTKGRKYVYVRGYTKKNGTEVKGYYRSMPDKDKTNNWTAKGNINPFTGKKGNEKEK
jgi:hypothetical protein